ncbi:MAG: hypothetical protein CME96_08585 [Hyphomonas sp.]|nr:hypothetical protein [Hyphomonas sp.]
MGLLCGTSRGGSLMDDRLVLIVTALLPLAAADTDDEEEDEVLRFGFFGGLSTQWSESWQTKMVSS